VVGSIIYLNSTCLDQKNLVQVNTWQSYYRTATCL